MPITGPGYEWLTSLIEAALQAPAGKPMLGISVDGTGAADEQKQIGGRNYWLVRRIEDLSSADIVPRAGAGGAFHRALREAAVEPARRGVRLSAKVREKQLRSSLDSLRACLAGEDVQGAVRALRKLSEA